MKKGLFGGLKGMLFEENKEENKNGVYTAKAGAPGAPVKGPSTGSAVENIFGEKKDELELAPEEKDVVIFDFMKMFEEDGKYTFDNLLETYKSLDLSTQEKVKTITATTGSIGVSKENLIAIIEDAETKIIEKGTQLETDAKAQDLYLDEKIEETRAQLEALKKEKEETLDTKHANAKEFEKISALVGKIKSAFEGVGE